jgi:hypothetical protein
MISNSRGSRFRMKRDENSSRASAVFARRSVHDERKSKMEAMVRLAMAFLLSIPVNMVYGRIARAILEAAGAILDESLVQAAEASAETSSSSLLHAMTAISWDTVLPWLTYAPALGTALAALESIRGLIRGGRGF